MTSAFSQGEAPCTPSYGGGVSWSTEQFIEAHLAVANSGKHNFEGCRIPVPTAVRYDRMRLALGESVSSKQEST